ncbi:sigma-54-dependent transcriptional regulator [Candidatus Symbiobacter mobilis]|uniref:NtrC family response regulator n=1 Tax=Candidatus Symbiobacter mobilis CR TaxID=946483 RepID=U5N8E4_9BURK|nr:sigma-54 dependent transcriptional regulator [Candidatus Symbiobacter mobilis]AGX86439.1 NtrC family response regulator [Candidatus Symbiobacter mobilis CR]
MPKTPPSHRSIRILVVDDEPDLRTLYELTLLREFYLVDTAESLRQARELLALHSYDALITDMRLPDGLGMELITQIKGQQRAERCIVITAYGSTANAIDALKAGAFDYLTKPVDIQQFRSVVASAVRHVADSQASARPASALHPITESLQSEGQRVLAKLTGRSQCIQALKARIVKIATSMAPVLITGESGTGKELVAYAIHANSHRASDAWVAVNCAAIPENLLEAEFFGARKGSFTGANQDRIGFFQAAQGGTLFLDEIGDLPLPMQSKLLRAIQERKIRPLGTTQEEPVDVRIISATHKSLSAEVGAGRFRQDLYYRLNVIDIVTTPLRDRLEDLPDLCEALLAKIARESGRAAPPVDAAFLTELSRMPLTGNVRELENLLHRAMALGDDNHLEFDVPVATVVANPPPDLHSHSAPELPPDAIRSGEVLIPSDLQQYLDDQERGILLRTLQETRFNRTAAAARLGLSLRQIRYRMGRLCIDVPTSASESGDDAS